MNKSDDVRRSNKRLRTTILRVIRKLDSYPYKHKGLIPFSHANMVIANTFRVDKNGCYAIYRDWEAWGFVKIHFQKGIEILQIPDWDEGVDENVN